MATAGLFVVITLAVVVVFVLPRIGDWPMWASLLLISLVFLAACSTAMRFFNPKQQPERIVVTEESVTRFLPDGTQEHVRWCDLAEVRIVTTGEGPMSEDVYWLLLASDEKSGCAISQGAQGMDILLNELQKLPGFDNGAVIEAMGSTSGAKFVCWKKSARPSA
jgi:hypothetical protein